MTTEHTPDHVDVDDADEYASADELLTGSLDLAGVDFTLPSGRKVRVRGLTRGELFWKGNERPSTADVEARNVAACLVRPVMSEAQVKRWQVRDLAGGDLKALSEKIRDLSGLGEGADKSDLPQVDE